MNTSSSPLARVAVAIALALAVAAAVAASPAQADEALAKLVDWIPKMG